MGGLQLTGATGGRPLPSSISIVIPAFNAEAHLDETIQCALSQAGPIEEIIVVDDGSTDRTPAIVDGYRARVRYLRQDNRGPAEARNVGVAAAGGELIAFLDADDVWTPRALPALLAGFTAPVDAVVGKVRFVRRHADGPYRDFGTTYAFNLGAGLFRRELFTRLGGFNRQAEPSEDVDWHMRLLEAGAVIAKIDDVTLEYRIHGDNLTLRQESPWGSFLQVLGRSIDRRQPTGDASPGEVGS